MKVYISGKITGLPYEEAWINFQMAEEMLIEEGYEVVNPLKNGLNPDDPWNAHMREDIKLLMDCDAIYLLDNCQYSTGGMIEWGIAARLGYKIMNVKPTRGIEISKITERYDND